MPRAAIISLGTECEREGKAVTHTCTENTHTNTASLSHWAICWPQPQCSYLCQSTTRGDVPRTHTCTSARTHTQTNNSSNPESEIYTRNINTRKHTSVNEVMTDSIHLKIYAHKHTSIHTYWNLCVCVCVCVCVSVWVCSSLVSLQHCSPGPQSPRSRWRMATLALTYTHTCTLNTNWCVYLHTHIHTYHIQISVKLSLSVTEFVIRW